VARQGRELDLKKKDEASYRVVGHRQDETCPACARVFFCDDCGICSECNFALPSFLEPPYPAWPLPMPSCSECKGTPSHTRDCPVTKRAAAAWDGPSRAKAKKVETMSAFDRVFKAMESPHAVAVYKRPGAEPWECWIKHFFMSEREVDEWKTKNLVPPNEVRWFKTTEEACAFAAEMESKVDPSLN
jgi:hypothetical protein